MMNRQKFQIISLGLFAAANLFGMAQAEEAQVKRPPARTAPALVVARIMHPIRPSEGIAKSDATTARRYDRLAPCPDAAIQTDGKCKLITFEVE